METIAVYKEERVKVYAITEKNHLALASLRFPAKDIEIWGLRVIDLEDCVQRFELVTYHAADKKNTELHLLIDGNKANNFSDRITAWIQNDSDTVFSLRQPVDVLYLFGPHFQDRFGIADTAFNALGQNGIDIFVSGCAGTSIYFVTPENRGRDGVTILTNTFLIPTTK